MSDITSSLSFLFVLMAAFYVCVQTALAISEVKSEEAGADTVPAAFRAYVTLAEHRKAIDYTGEIIQCDLVSAWIGALIALLLTVGNGFTLLLAGTATLVGPGVASHVTLAIGMSLVLALIDFPLSWWKDFRINERYGFETTPPKIWLAKALRDMLLGWCSLAPVLLAVLIVCDIASYRWWMFAVAVTTIWWCWRILLIPKILGFRHAKPMQDGKLKKRLDAVLSQLGYEDIEICTMHRPKSWRHGHALLVRRFGRLRLVVFNHVVSRLNVDEVCAVAAGAVGRYAHCHDALRVVFFVTLSGFFWWALSYLAEKTWFYEALNIEPGLAIPNGAINPGLIFCICLTIVPIALYPLVFLIHAFTRRLHFDEDTYAVMAVGGKPLVRALTKLHRDYRNSQVPNAWYSLANHSRPHVTQRIQRALRVQQWQHFLHVQTVKAEKSKQAERFNKAMELDRARRDARIEARLLRQCEIQREADALRRRTFTLQHETDSQEQQ